MQVSNKKVQPHVLYCSIWRWSDVRNQHELRNIPGKFSIFNKNFSRIFLIYYVIMSFPPFYYVIILSFWARFSECEYSHHLRRDLICVNPYHYERVRPQPLPPVLVPRLPPNAIPERFMNFDSLASNDFDNQEWVVADNFNLES